MTLQFCEIIRSNISSAPLCNILQNVIKVSQGVQNIFWGITKWIKKYGKLNFYLFKTFIR